jgi:adenylosuccinate lyase
MENVALWHERDISHSSGERIILPGAFTLVGYMLGQFDAIMRGIRVFPGRMKRNLELTGGLIFSQAVMLALTEAGLDRQQAYKIVQGHAMGVWEQDALGESGPTFLERLHNDPEVTSRIPDEELRELFSLERHLKHVDEAYRRVGLEG